MSIEKHIELSGWTPDSEVCTEVRIDVGEHCYRITFGDEEKWITERDLNHWLAMLRRAKQEHKMLVEESDA